MTSRSLFSVGLGAASLVLCQCLLPAAATANPVLEAGRFAIALDGGGSYLDLPALPGAFGVTDFVGTTIFLEPAESEAWGPALGLSIEGGLGDLFGIGQPVGIAFRASYRGFETAGTLTNDWAVTGLTNFVTSPEGSSAQTSEGLGLFHGEQKVSLIEMDLTLSAPIPLGEGWLLRPSIGPSFMLLSRNLDSRAVLGGFEVLDVNEELDTDYIGGLVGLAVEADFGGGFSAALGIAGGAYYSHSSHRWTDNGLPGFSFETDEEDGFAWRGRAELALAYDFGWASLGVSAGFDYVSEAPTLERFDPVDVLLGTVGPPIEDGDDFWGAQATATLRVPF